MRSKSPELMSEIKKVYRELLPAKQTIPIDYKDC